MHRIIPLLVVFCYGLVSLNCQHSGEMADTSAVTATPPPAPIGIHSLPEPAEDTIEMLLNDKRYTLVTKIECQKVPLNFGNTIAFQRLPGQTPTFFISRGDLSTPPGNINISLFDNWALDMDDNEPGVVGWLPTANGCAATITTSTADIFEMNASDCKLRNATNAIDGKLSFKLRCRKA